MPDRQISCRNLATYIRKWNGPTMEDQVMAWQRTRERLLSRLIMPFLQWITGNVLHWNVNRSTKIRVFSPNPHDNVVCEMVGIWAGRFVSLTDTNVDFSYVDRTKFIFLNIFPVFALIPSRLRWLPSHYTIRHYSHHRNAFRVTRSVWGESSCHSVASKCQQYGALIFNSALPSAS